MQAQAEIRPLFVSHTEDRSITGKEFQARWGEFSNRRTQWERFRLRQAMWQAIQQLLQDGASKAQLEKAVEQMEVYRKGAKPSSLNPVTLDSRYVPEAHRVSAVVNPDTIEEAVYGARVVEASRQQRVDFWLLVELAVMGFHPLDLRRPLDVDHQFDLECAQIKGLVATYGFSTLVEYQQNKRDRQVQARIYSGVDRGVLMLTTTQAAMVRQMAALFIKAGNRHSRVAQVVATHPSQRATLELLPEGTEPKAANQALLLDWLTFGIEDRGQYADLSKLRRSPVKYHLPEKPIDLGEGSSHQHHVQIRLFAFAAGTYAALPQSLKSRIATLLEYHYGTPHASLFAADERHFDQLEMQLFGCKITRGSSFLRHRFWEFMHYVSCGMKSAEESTSAYPQPWGDNHVRVQEAAANLITEGYDPQRKCKPLEYGRAGLTVPLELNDPEGEGVGYKPIYFFLTSGLLYY